VTASPPLLRPPPRSPIASSRSAPEVRFWPAILCFLGYDPRPEQETFGGQLRAASEAEGLSEEALARQLGLDPGTLAAWKRDEVSRPYQRIRQVFVRYPRLGLVKRAAYRSENSALGTCLSVEDFNSPSSASTRPVSGRPEEHRP
jgi:hypothetical protein